jgi:N-acetylmuramoyl-L-alanine amidase
LATFAALSPVTGGSRPAADRLAAHRPPAAPTPNRLTAAATSGPAAATANRGLHSSSNAGAAIPAAVAPSGDGRGFWIAETDGAVMPEGDAHGYGDASRYNLAAPVVGIATAAAGAGYWLLGSDGGVFSYGDAGFHGSTGAMRLNQPALEMAATSTGRGYWFVARDGGIFSFGDAGFYGSTGSMRLNQPVVGLAATPTGRGYWLVARDGGIFAFGDARYFGSTGSIRLNQPVVGMAATPTGRGYWLVARDGGIFNFGDAGYHGSLGGTPLPAPVIGMVPAQAGQGYWLALGNGQVRAFGDAAPVNTPPVDNTAYSLVGYVIGIDPGHNGGNGADPGYINRPVWNGREYESCDTTGTETDAGYTEAAFNFDVATRLAALLRSYGATVVLTRTSNSGVGPCITTRAQIINGSRADAALDIHADGGPPGGRGTTVLEPVADGPNDGVIQPSDRLAVIVRDAFQGSTGEPESTYDGTDGLQPRIDLAGLNLTTVPKVLIECANMRNATDAASLTNPDWRQQAAQGLALGAAEFLTGYP